MARRLLQIGRVQPGHHFQADRYGPTERRRRRDRSIRYRVASWWASAGPIDRAWRLFCWAILLSFGLAVGVIAATVLSTFI